MRLIDLVNSKLFFLLSFLLESLTLTLTCLLFWIYFYLLAPAFVRQRLSLHWEILIMPLSQFLLTWLETQKMDAPFHRLNFDYSFVDWDNPCDHLRDVTWEFIFKLGVAAAASEFSEWIQARTNVYIACGKYQVMAPKKKVVTWNGLIRLMCKFKQIQLYSVASYWNKVSNITAQKVSNITAQTKCN